MNFTDPKTVTSPKASVSDLAVLLNTGEGGWSLASLRWDGKPVYGIRWNGHPENPIGNPQSRGIPTWFVLPEELNATLQARLNSMQVRLASGASSTFDSFFPEHIKRVRLRPLPKRLLGGKDQGPKDFIWNVEKIDKEKGTVWLTNPATGHYMPINAAHVETVVSDPFPEVSDGFNHGILKLTVQLIFEDTNIRLELPRPDGLEQPLRMLIDDAGRGALEFLPAINFDKRQNWLLVPVCIYASIVELFYGCMALISGKQWTTLPVVIRSMMESYADLKASSVDKDYWKHLHANNVKELLRITKKADPSHQILAGLFAAGDVAKRKAELEKELQQALKAGRGPLLQEQRFAKANLGPEYDSVYWNLCQEGHNSLSALESRHLEYKGDEYSVVAFRQDPKMLLGYMDAMLVTLIGSSQTVHRMFNTPAAGDFFAQLEKRWNELRKDYINRTHQLSPAQHGEPEENVS